MSKYEIQEVDITMRIRVATDALEGISEDEYHDTRRFANQMVCNNPHIDTREWAFQEVEFVSYREVDVVYTHVDGGAV